MLGKKGIMGLVLLGVVALALALSACGGVATPGATPGAAPADLAALQQQLSAKDQEVASLKQQLAAATAGGPQLAAVQQQLAAKEKELADLNKYVMLRAIPDRPPRPTSTPLPPGATPAPTPTPPPAKVVPLAFYVDTVTAGAGESKFNVDAQLGCARTSIFKRGQFIVWRMEATDTSNGKVLQAADVESAVLKLPNGENLNMRFGRHGATATSPWFWAIGWAIPMDFPLGTINYTIEVKTKDGKVGTFKELVLEVPAGNTSGVISERLGLPIVNAGLMVID